MNRTGIMLSVNAGAEECAWSFEVRGEIVSDEVAAERARCIAICLAEADEYHAIADRADVEGKSIIADRALAAATVARRLAGRMGE